jgi:hypothetical protein
VRDVSIDVSVLGINVGKRHHRHVIGCGIGHAERKCLGERDGLAMLAGWREQTFAEFEPFNQMVPLLFRRLEIAVFRVGKDEVKSQEPRLDVIEFVLPAIAEMGFANRFINLARTEMIDETSPGVSLGCGVSQAKQFFDEAGVPLAASGMAEVKELPHREIAGMRCRKTEKPRFGLGVTESGEVGELGVVNAHGL